MIVYVIALVAVCVLAVVDDGFQTGAGTNGGAVIETGAGIGSETRTESDRRGRHKHGSKQRTDAKNDGRQATAIGDGVTGGTVAQTRPWFLSANGTSDFVKDLAEKPSHDKTSDDMKQQMNKAGIKQKSGKMPGQVGKISMFNSCTRRFSYIDVPVCECR